MKATELLVQGDLKLIVSSGPINGWPTEPIGSRSQMTAFQNWVRTIMDVRTLNNQRGRRSKTPSERHSCLMFLWILSRSKEHYLGAYDTPRRDNWHKNNKTSQKPKIWMKNVSTHDAFCKKISIHEPNNHLNGDEVYSLTKNTHDTL